MKSTAAVLMAGAVFLLHCHPAELLRPRVRNWEGRLAFHEDFDRFEVRQDHWTIDQSCNGEEPKNRILECFIASDNNVKVANGSLIIRSLFKPSVGNKLYDKPKLFTSGSIRTRVQAFTQGAFVFSAKMPKGRFLRPSIRLVPGRLRNDQNCKYEEITVVESRGDKPSNLIFSASFGRNKDSLSTKRVERAFPGTDFSAGFHEFALVWRPLRMEWYVDGARMATVSTHFYSDWILPDESNVPCSPDKSLFKEPLHLAISLAVGTGTKATVLDPDDPGNVETATLEVDWVKVYQG